VRRDQVTTMLSSSTDFGRRPPTRLTFSNSEKPFATIEILRLLVMKHVEEAERPVQLILRSGARWRSLRSCPVLPNRLPTLLCAQIIEGTNIYPPPELKVLSTSLAFENIPTLLTRCAQTTLS
jgi:hypothetical protein